MSVLVSKRVRIWVLTAITIWGETLIWGENLVWGDRLDENVIWGDSILGQ